MIFLVLDQESKRIVHISKTIRENEIGGMILDSGINMAPGVGEIIEYHDELPEIIEPEKYFYRNGEFIRNPAYPEEVEQDNSVEKPIETIEEKENVEEEPTKVAE